MRSSRKAFWRVLSFALALCMLVGLIPVQALATEGTESKSDYDFEVSKSSATVDSSGEVPMGYIRNEFIEAYITGEGHYTIGTVEGDPNSSTDNNKMLLFGHPGSSTTETLVRIDGRDYFFDDYVTAVEFNGAGTECVATATIDGITVQQILTLQTNPYTNIEDVVRIRYTYINNSTVAKQVGIRIMLDTMLGSNDGSPFRVNGEDVTREIEFTGNSVPQYWQSFDSLEQPNVTATGFFYFSETEKPDKVQFAYWGSIHGSSWDYRINTSTYVTNDSAVAAYFNPRTVAAGGRNSVVTYYGVSGFSNSNSDLDGNLAVRITAPSALFGSDMIGGYLNNPFDVSVYVTSPGSETLRNVRAVLSLEGAPQLVLDGSQATTIRLGDMYSGDNATIQWTLRALPQGRSSVVNYSISFYSGNTLLKTMPLTLELAELNENDMYRTVTFNLNGGDGTAPAAQRVLVGSFAERPANPTREGYLFAGWYANRSCTGQKWFSVFNLYHGNIVTEDVTLYAKWSKAQDLTYGEDTYDFVNSQVDFFGWWDSLWTSGNYKLTGDYYDTLMEGRTETERTRLREKMNSSWGGSCFGMSAVLSLVRAGALDVDYFQSNATYLNDLDTPNDNSAVFNLVNYYHLMQYTSRTRSLLYNGNGEADNNRAIISALNESAYPVVVCFYGLKNNVVDWGHAVVAYGYTETDSQYRVFIWDPNDKDNPNTLIINKNNWMSAFENKYDSGTDSTEIICALTVESAAYDYKNLQDELMDLGHSSGADAVSLLAADDATRELMLETNYAAFEITGSDGSYAVVEDGVVTSGTLSITDGIPVNEDGPELKLEYTISDSGDVQYTIIPVDAISEVTGEPLAEYSTVLYCAEENGFYSKLTAADTGTIIFEANGGISDVFETETEHTIIISTNDTETPWNSVTVEGTNTGMNVSQENDSTNISALTDTQVTVRAEEDYNGVIFESVDLETNEEVELTADPDNSCIAVLGEEIREMGYALIFYSHGGTPIEAQANIPAGSTATQPENPTREGFVFDGWYTTPECEDGNEWSFETSIEDNTRIYAKWLTDEDYMHAVTFRAEGHDDIVIIVRDGEALSEDQIPAVPEKNGCPGVWDITDFSSITSDLIVNAVYEEHEHNYEAVVTDPTCTEQGYTTYTCACGDSYVGDYTDPLGHDYVNGTCSHCGEPEGLVAGVTRLAGADRYYTCISVANQLKENLGVEKFESVVIAYGQNFPDALTGSYLAAVKDAPILLWESAVDTRMMIYIAENLVPGGTIYILGGASVVDLMVEAAARYLGYNPIRLKGANRYETNLAILREAGVNTTDEVLIATGKNYADSLSASATGLPMLLVGDELTPEQRDFLMTTSRRFAIIGGTGAVSESVEEELSILGSVVRIKGSSRYETSVEIARRYFDNPRSVVLAYSHGFPDGLCGGPLAVSMGAPLILTSNESYSVADDYVSGIGSGVVTGGASRISDEVVRDVFDLEDYVEIPKK